MLEQLANDPDRNALGSCMMAATPAKLGSVAEACRSKAQHAVILAFCS
jgi:hypothetical protein